MGEGYNVLRCTLRHKQKQQDVCDASYRTPHCIESSLQRNSGGIVGKDCVISRNVSELQATRLSGDVGSLPEPMLTVSLIPTSEEYRGLRGHKQPFHATNLSESGGYYSDVTVEDCAWSGPKGDIVVSEGWRGHSSSVSGFSSLFQRRFCGTHSPAKGEIGLQKPAVNCYGDEEMVEALTSLHSRPENRLSINKKTPGAVDDLKYADKRRAFHGCCCCSSRKPNDCDVGSASTRNPKRLQVVSKYVAPHNTYGDVSWHGVSSSALPEQTFWIHIWPCFGSIASSICRPTRVVVQRRYCYIEQLIEKVAIATCCRPAPSVLYEPDGFVVRSLAQLIPDQHYLLFPSGGFYRRESVPAALLKLLVEVAKDTLHKHRFRGEH